jgi:hypothetical protein
MLVLEVEDVDGASCKVDDMKKVEVLDNLGIGVGGNGLQWRGGREKRGLGYEVMGGRQDADGAGARL